MLGIEQAIIGGLLTNQAVMGEIYKIVEPQMFRDALLGKIYFEIRKAYDNGVNADLPYYVQAVCSDGRFPQNVVLEAMQNAIKTSVTTATIKSDATALANDYMAREFTELLNRTVANPANITEQISETIDKLAKLKIGWEISERSLSKIAERYESDYFKDREENRIEIGFPQLDTILGGLEGGDVVLIGARPAVGKSAFATQVSGNLGNIGKRVAYFNLEMSEKQVYERFIVNESGIGLTRLRRAVCFLNDEEKRFKEANKRLREKNNIVISTGSKSVSEIRAESKMIKPDIVVVDYMQLLKPESNYRGNRYAEVGAISHALKAMAMEFNIPIIVLAQLNRVSTERDNKEPTMSEFRESGDCEQDASQIILLWNKDENDRSLKGCKVEKNRQGITGKIELQFNGDLMKFVEVKAGAYRPSPIPADMPLPNNVKDEQYFEVSLNDLEELPFLVED